MGDDDAARVPMGVVKAMLKTHTGIGANSTNDQYAKELYLAIQALESNYVKPFLSAVYNQASETTDGVLERVITDNIADVERYHTLTNQLKTLEAAKSIIHAY
ncbi:hypothetical protein H310_02112 [Aphanomyces invadans]|uniref:GED domain-containing protein n=1 Tax=Aphanomyces invadans TaxID=157072 RepID=A0A024UN88_9STRA|nr:hypothetical protein H310_02112 [Aphanomyces invadans]ETW07645.1 hypothetical protein H310_02112 [Aphanomyces invadans]|eukprot:XP_008863738.1 hypothetical protein H310_02112 [Aphanomyces invadans]